MHGQVEPFSRALAELDVDCMINGRRRDHGFDRAHLEARVWLLGLPHELHTLLVCMVCWCYP